MPEKDIMMRRETSDSPSKSIWVLWALVIILLILNLALLYGRNKTRLTAIETLNQVELKLDKLAHEVIVYDIAVNQTVPIKTDVPIDMEIPVNFNDSIHVDTTVQLDTTVPVTIDIGQTTLADYFKQVK